MGTKIKVTKVNDNVVCDSNDSELSNRIQDMEDAIKKFFDRLEKPNDEFQASSAFDELLRYITNYDRVLYSTISNLIYGKYESSGSFDVSGTLLSNLDKLVKYSENSDNIIAKKQTLGENQTEKAVDDTRKAILKIWDHVTLASHQYTMLKQSDAEYDEKFKQRISKYKEEMSKEMSTQMITMVGIFTALAFLIFGSISSLDGIFENLHMPIFKVICIGLIWGICISNMIFVFLYCIGKMTKLNFKSNTAENASSFQKYPLVWWTNFILISLLLVSSWGYFLQQSIISEWLLNTVNCHPQLAFILGTAAIALIIFFCAKHLHKHMKKHCSNTIISYKRF